MQPTHPPPAPSMSDQELERERRKLITEVYALGIALNEYVPSGDLCNEYDTMNRTPLSTRVRELGYKSVDDMLMKCGCFVTAVINNKKRFKADATSGNQATQDLSSLVRRQTKKKQKGPKISTDSRQYFTRNSSRSKSFHGRTAFGAGFAKSNSSVEPLPSTRAPEYLVKRDDSASHRPVHGPPKGFSLPHTSRKTSSAVSQQNESGMKLHKVVIDDSAEFPFIIFNGSSSSTEKKHENSQASVRNATSPGRYPPCSSRASSTASPSGAGSGYSPAAGVQRFLTALRRCNGMASADQLRKKYKELYKVDWNEHELKKYFGMTSSRRVIETYLEDLVEITSIRGAGLRCYKLIERESESQLRQKHPSKVINLLPLDSISNLYREKFGAELVPETQFQMSWKKLVLEKFANYIKLDMRGYLYLNMEEPEVKDMVMRKRVITSLEADIDSDSYESCISSPSQSTSELPDLPRVTFRIPKQEPVEDRTVYVDTSYQVKREVHKIKQEPIERMFERNMRLTRSFHGRSTITAYYGDEELSDVAGADLPVKVKRVSFPLSFPASEYFMITAAEMEHFLSMYLLLVTFMSSRPSTSNSYHRNDTLHVKNDVPNGYIIHTGKENVVPERDVECAHPYFNVHVKSATGDARSLAVQRGSVEFHWSSSNGAANVPLKIYRFFIMELCSFYFSLKSHLPDLSVWC
ncbi:hypothetical protein ANCCAN_05263 [Ancylostoma caninum]|uniref:HTH OST-type domain-containing protein n=1 Tax=Ancylostoma caninum TaxID=29170 RepID=A0A368GWC4_ANCCA|nr:hypothetical protein ANCCAN_05263 [Ancylostoma caninum]